MSAAAPRSGRPRQARFGWCLIAILIGGVFAAEAGFWAASTFSPWFGEGAGSAVLRGALMALLVVPGLWWTTVRPWRQRLRGLLSASNRLDTVHRALDRSFLVSVTDRRGRIIDANEPFCALSGYSREELLGQDHRILSSGTHPKSFWVEMYKTVARGQPWRGEVCNRAKDGSLYWVDSQIVPEFDARGRIMSYVSIRVDITKRRQADELADEVLNELALQRQELQEIIDAVPSVILVRNQNGVITNLNHAAASRYGRPTETLRGRSLADVAGHEAARRVIAADRETLAAGKPILGLIESRTNDDGHDEVLQIDRVPIGLGHEMTSQVVTIEHDITEQVRAQHDLAILQERYERAVAGSSDGLWDWTPGTGTAWYSENFLSMLGYGPSEHDLFGQTYESWEQRVHADDLPGMLEDVRRHVDDFVPLDTSFRMRMRSGEYRWFRSRGRAERDENGEVVRISGSMTDIHEHRVASTRLSLAMRSADLGLWDWSIKTGEIYFGDEFYTMLGYEPGELPMRLGTWKKLCHPDDVESAVRALEDHCDGKTPTYECEQRLRCKNGDWLWIRGIGEVVERDEDGSPLRMIGVHIDIDAEQRARIENDRLAERLKIATEGAGIGVWDVDLDRGHLLWDQTMHDLYGVEMTGEMHTLDTWKSRVHPDDVESAIAQFELAALGESDFDTSFRVVLPNGTFRHIRGIASFIRDDEGRAVRAVGANWDITPMKSAFDAMNEAQRVARVGSWEYDVVTHNVTWTEQLYKMFGRDPSVGPPDFDEVVGYYCDEDEARLRAAVRDAIEHGIDYSITMRVRNPGTVEYVRGEGRVRRDRDGKIVRLFGTAMDVTEQVKREAALREIDMALDAAGDCVFMFDGKSLLFTYANKGATTQVGYSREELACMTPLDIKPDIETERFGELLEGLQEDESRSANFRTVHQHRDGTRVPVQVAMKFVPKLGEHGRYIAIVRDITVQLADERRMEDAKREAEKASRAKSDFLANMSHEIRTPMTAILGYADLLEADSGAPENDQVKQGPTQSVAIRTIRSNARHLLTIINDILDMSKIEAGKMTVEHGPTDLVSIMCEVESLLQEQARGKGIDVVGRLDTPIPETISSDPTRVRQIMLNLVGNAIKFTEAGHVEISLSHDADRGTVEMAIRDTGIGLSAEKVRELSKFDAFQQADASMSRRFGGTGLGLRISNAFAEMLGGGLRIESAPGRGTTVTATIATGDVGGSAMVRDLEAKRSRDAARTKERNSVRDSGTRPLSQKRILLVEDGPDNQRLISFHLQKAGAEVVLGGNGRLGIAAFEAEGGRFDLILMDMQMPEMDGYEASARLRGNGCETPIIALTAHAMQGDRDRCLAAGCDDYMTKPIDKTSLIETCLRWTRRSERRSA